MSIFDKIISFLSPITREIGATHCVVIFYNAETGVSQGIGTFNGFNDILHGADVIEDYANQLRNGVTLQ